VVAIGGGNTALEESDYLTRFAEKVYLVHRRDEFRGSKIAQRLVRNNPKIELVLSSVPIAINGDKQIESIDVRNVQTAEVRNIKTDGVFLFAGQIPATETFADLVKLSEDGYIIADESTQTSVPGVYAAGDVRVKEVRQIVTAAADGAVAAKMAAKYIQNLSAGYITAEGDVVQS
jgi:thioredoxin reductase (NADPH)